MGLRLVLLILGPVRQNIFFHLILLLVSAKIPPVRINFPDYLILHTRTITVVYIYNCTPVDYGYFIHIFQVMRINMRITFQYCTIFDQFTHQRQRAFCNSTKTGIIINTKKMQTAFAYLTMFGECLLAEHGRLPKILSAKSERVVITNSNC